MAQLHHSPNTVTVVGYLNGEPPSKLPGKIYLTVDEETYGKIERMTSQYMGNKPLLRGPGGCKLAIRVPKLSPEFVQGKKYSISMQVRLVNVPRKNSEYTPENMSSDYFRVVVLYADRINVV